MVQKQAAHNKTMLSRAHHFSICVTRRPVVRNFSVSNPSPYLFRGSLLAAPAPAPLQEEETQLAITDYIMEGAAMSFEPIYRVILHYTNWTDHKDIANVVKKAVPTISKTHALRTVENAAAYGSAIVVTVPQDEAEMYEARLNRMGLKASLEIA